MLECILGSSFVGDPSRGGMQPAVHLFAYSFVEMQLANKSLSSRKHLLTFMAWSGSPLDAVSSENSICLVCHRDLMQVPRSFKQEEPSADPSLLGQNQR